MPSRKSDLQKKSGKGIPRDLPLQRRIDWDVVKEFYALSEMEARTPSQELIHLIEERRKVLGVVDDLMIAAALDGYITFKPREDVAAWLNEMAATNTTTAAELVQKIVEREFEAVKHG